jgi:hypothetical protein
MKTLFSWVGLPYERTASVNERFHPSQREGVAW